MDFTAEEIGEILQLLDETAHDELTIKTARMQIVLRRGNAGGWTQETRTLHARPAIVPDGSAEATPAEAIATGDGRQAAADVIEIRSPLPGTFYRAPRPGADPFVEAGSCVSKHTVVAIIETMKLMNSIPAGVEGEVLEICAGNGDLVEAATVLMRIKVARP